MLLNVGIPYFLLSSTGPLIQAWFSRSCVGRSPYRLYALSNVGSLAALLTYPFLLEPAMTTQEQGRTWSVGFCVFVVFCGYCAMKIWRLQMQDKEENTSQEADSGASVSTHGQPHASPAGAPGWSRRATWLVLPCFASIMLLATTNHVCQDVAVIPFLWVLPLSLYLLSFILTFDSDRWYSRRVCGWSALLCIALSSCIAVTGYLPHILVEVAVSFFTLLVICMICHGELVARKPNPEYLTQFYLMCSVGGALGGIVVAMLCPLVFSNFFEMNLMLLLGYVLALVVAFGGATTGWPAPGSRWRLVPQIRSPAALGRVFA